MATPVRTAAPKPANKNVQEDRSSGKFRCGQWNLWRLNNYWLHLNLEDSSSDEETPDLRPKIQALMSAYFEEVKHQGFRDIRGRKSCSVNFVQNEEKRSSGVLTVVVFKIHFTKPLSSIQRSLWRESQQSNPSGNWRWQPPTDSAARSWWRRWRRVRVTAAQVSLD